jgi:hypothetical protein
MGLRSTGATFAGVERRYNCIGMQTFVVPGAPPKPAARAPYNIALRCLRAGLSERTPVQAALAGGLPYRWRENETLEGEAS